MRMRMRRKRGGEKRTDASVGASEHAWDGDDARSLSPRDGAACWPEIPAACACALCNNMPTTPTRQHPARAHAHLLQGLSALGDELLHHGSLRAMMRAKSARTFHSLRSELQRSKHPPTTPTHSTVHTSCALPRAPHSQTNPQHSLPNAKLQPQPQPQPQQQCNLTEFQTTTSP
eukprot:3204756-Rhodomonas_salina.2